MALDEIRRFREEKLQRLSKLGSAYPISTNRDFPIENLLNNFDKIKDSEKEIAISGRIMAKRGQGALIFIDLNDGSGKVQALFKKGEVDDDLFISFSENSDIGDFILVSGKAFVTERGEKTIAVIKWKMLAKSLRPLPEKWEGIKDSETAMRQRYLQILTDEVSKAKFLQRIKAIDFIRRFLTKNGYLEVETPMFQPLYGGASALPFMTHYNALETDFYLRISPELYLKRLLVAGFPKVFELNRNFRNEGIDVTHSPEFTMLEFYEAYATAEDQRNFTEKLFRELTKEVVGSTVFTNEGEEIDTTPEFAVISYFDLLQKFGSLTSPEKMSREEASLEAERLGVTVLAEDTLAKIFDNIYKKLCRPKLVQPTFIIDYPVSMLPLAKRKEDNSKLVDAFQLVVGGVEIVKAFSELNDPSDQRARFLEQEENKKMGEADSQSLDEDFLEALEYGMPPAAGVGIGIDRLVMLLTDTHNIRDIILFPTLKPKK